MVRSHPGSSSHIAHLSLALEPRLSQALDLGALRPWKAHRHLRGVSIKEGVENRHPLTSWVKCIEYHPAKPQAFWEMKEGVNHEEFASFTSLLPLTKRLPDG